MEKIAAYKSIIKEVLDEVVGDGDKPSDEVRTQIIKDDIGGHYLLFSNGWKLDKRYYGCYLHIDVAEDGKIWVQHEGTDLIVVQMILDKGVPKSDIVLAFHPPYVRADTEFAVA